MSNTAFTPLKPESILIFLLSIITDLTVLKIGETVRLIVVDLKSFLREVKNE